MHTRTIGSELRVSFENLMNLLQKSISISDDLDSMMKNMTIEELIQKRDQETSTYIKTVLEKVQKTLSKLLYIPIESKPINFEHENLTEPLNESEICKYSSEYLKFSRAIRPGALKVCTSDNQIRSPQIFFLNLILIHS